jgi:hypothetical protein
MSILKTNQITDLGGNELLTSNGSGVISSGGAITNTPAFMVLNNNAFSVPDSTNTAVTFDTVIYDTDSATSNGLFTCPSGKAGKYFFTANGGLATANDVDEVLWCISKNGQTGLSSTAGDIVCADYHHDGTQVSNYTQAISAVFDLAVGDTVGVRCYQNFGSSKNTNTDGRCTFSGYKLIGA